ILINEDFPTLDRPIKAYSGSCSLGQLRTLELLMTKSADFICICLILIDYYKFRFANHDSNMALNSIGCSIMGACPHLSIQKSSESGRSEWNSSATFGVVT